MAEFVLKTHVKEDALQATAFTAFKAMITAAAGPEITITSGHRASGSRDHSSGAALDMRYTEDGKSFDSCLRLAKDLYAASPLLADKSRFRIEVHQDRPEGAPMTGASSVDIDGESVAFTGRSRWHVHARWLGTPTALARAKSGALGVRVMATSGGFGNSTSYRTIAIARFEASPAPQAGGTIIVDLGKSLRPRDTPLTVVINRAAALYKFGPSLTTPFRPRGPYATNAFHLMAVARTAHDARKRYLLATLGRWDDDLKGTGESEASYAAFLMTGKRDSFARTFDRNCILATKYPERYANAIPRVTYTGMVALRTMGVLDTFLAEVPVIMDARDYSLVAAEINALSDARIVTDVPTILSLEAFGGEVVGDRQLVKLRERRRVTNVSAVISRAAMTMCDFNGYVFDSRVVVRTRNNRMSRPNGSTGR